MVAGHPRCVSERRAPYVQIARARGGDDVADPVHLVLAVFEIGMHRHRDVREQGPGSRGPDDELALRVRREREGHVHRVRLHLLVAEREFVGRERRAAARAVGQHLVPAVEERLLVQPFEEPPHRLDVLVGVGDIWVGVVKPIADALR